MRGISFREYIKSWRDEIDSEDITNDYRGIHDDLGEAFRRGQYINNRLTEYAGDLNYQNQQLNSRINELVDMLVAASGHYATASGNLMYWNAYSNNEIVSSSSRQDLIIGDVTLPWSRSWTKLPLILDEYGNYVASTVVRAAYDDGTEVYLEKPDDIYDALDNNPETNWVKSYLTAVAPGSVTVRVELPAGTNPAINSIYVAPFPEGGPTITNLRYLTSNGAWNQVSNFARSGRKVRYHFSPTDYNEQIDVTLEPTTLLDSDGAQVKVFGLQVLDVSLIEYVDSSQFILRLDAADGTDINNLTYVYLNYTISPNVNESNISDTDMPVVIEIYEDAGLTTRVYSNQIYDHPYTGTLSLVTPSSSVWVRITLREINSTTPVVKELTVKYN